MKKCIKSEKVKTLHGFDICKEIDKKCDPETGETYGRAMTFYAVYDGEWMIDSKKTLKEAENLIKKLL